MAKPERADPFLADTLEYEAAILQALEAMAGNNRQKKLDAFARFSKIYDKTLRWPLEQKVHASRRLAERGQIEDTAWMDVLDAMHLFLEEYENQLDLFEDYLSRISGGNRWVEQPGAGGLVH